VVVRARELRDRGREAAAELPSRDDLAERPDDERRAFLERLRVDLYAISSLVAEATVQRAFRDRDEHPPYGLVRSGHTDYRMLLANPKTVTEGSVESFYDFGKAYVDTMVFHLDRELNAQLASDRGWMLQQLDLMLALFSIGAGPATRARLRDRFAFIYGGLHFGTSVCVQLTEVMSRLLGPYNGLTSDDKVEVMSRSAHPANRLAAFNVDHVIIAYQDLLAPVQPSAALGGPATARWFDATKFVVQEVDGRPRRIDFRNEEGLGGRPRGRKLLEVPTTYSTLGCPARVAPGGGPSAIATLWSWAVTLAQQLGFLG
jgi:hypothetical protein